MVPESRSRPVGLYAIITLQLIVAVPLALYLLALEEVVPVLRVLVRNPIYSLLTPG